MKKVLAALSLIALLAIPSLASDASVYCHSDITATIDGAAISSYNIDGHTVVCAEDLVDYGFTVRYFDDLRTLAIDHARAPITADYTPAPLTVPIGTVAGQILASDITVVLGGRDISGYNIGGRTLIRMDALTSCGTVTWDPHARTTAFETVAPWICPIESDDEAVFGTTIASVALQLTKTDETFTVTGEHLGYLEEMALQYSKDGGLVFRFSLYQNLNAETTPLHSLMNDMVNIDYEGVVHREDTVLANERIDAQLNGEDIAVSWIRLGIGNGHTDFYISFKADLLITDLHAFRLRIE